jgi:hypothetical protein
VTTRSVTPPQVKPRTTPHPQPRPRNVISLR